MKWWRLQQASLLTLVVFNAVFASAVQAQEGGKAGGISYMRETNSAVGPQTPNFVFDNRSERRNYSLLEAARITLGPKATQPACADRLPPGERADLQQLAKNEDTTVSPKLTHQILLHQETLQELRQCVRVAEAQSKLSRR